MRIINGYSCKTGLEYYFAMDPKLVDVYKPMPSLDMINSAKQFYKATTGKPGNQTNLTETLPMQPTYQANQIPLITNILLPTTGQSFLRYASIRFLDTPRIGDVLWGSLLPTDSFNYIMSINTPADHSVTLATYGPCSTLDHFTLTIPVMNNKSEVDHMLLYVIQNRQSPQTAVFHSVDYKRDMNQRPGVRLIVAFETKASQVDLIKGNRILVTLSPDMLKKRDKKGKVEDEDDFYPPSPLVWLVKGDGTNLIIRAKGKKLIFNYTLGAAEMVDIFVAVKDNGHVVSTRRSNVGFVLYNDSIVFLGGQVTPCSSPGYNKWLASYLAVRDHPVWRVLPGHCGSPAVDSVYSFEVAVQRSGGLVLDVGYNEFDNCCGVADWSATVE